MISGRRHRTSWNRYQQDGRFLAPGIADDTRGLVAMLSVIGAMNANGVRTQGDVLFVATVGEEELGNLRGMKALFRDHKGIDGFISIDGTAIDRATTTAAGSHRYEAVFKGPGGHSFRHFGLPSAIHAMGRAVARISDLETPAQPRTTFTVGTVRGGTSVNAIAGEARIAIDMRSSDNSALADIDRKSQEAVKAGVTEENRRWKSDQITVEIKLIGEVLPAARPTARKSSRLSVARRWASDAKSRSSPTAAPTPISRCPSASRRLRSVAVARVTASIHCANGTSRPRRASDRR